MPFSKENIRYTLTLILIGFVATVTIAGAVYLVQHDKQTANLWLVGGGILTGLLGFARAEFRAKESATQRKEILAGVDKAAEKAEIAAQKADEIESKTNGNLGRAIEKVAKHVREARDQPAPGQEGMPRNPAELQALIKTFVETRDKSCERIAKEAATAVTAETVRLVVEELRNSGALILPHKNDMQIIPDETKNKGEGI